MLDKLKNQKDLLHNFIEWSRKHGGGQLPVEALEEITIDTFLNTQHAGSRFIAVCAHCGSSKKLMAGDFKHELLIDNDPRSPGFSNGKKESVSKSSGPAWVCGEKDCGHYTPRMEGDVLDA